MAKVNTCLKLTFTIFNIIFAIIGGLIIGLALIYQLITSSHGDYTATYVTSIITLYVLGTVTMVVAILGAYGAQKENKGALTIFLVCMVIGCLLTLRFGVKATLLRPELRELMESEIKKNVVLDKAPEEVKEKVDFIQDTLQCCGLYSYTEWEENIPDSCVCSQEAKEQGACHMVSSQKIFMQEQKFIYSEPCFPILIQKVQLFYDILICVDFVLVILALLGVILSSVIIHQIRVSQRPTVLMTMPAIFSTPPPKYQELHNTLNY